MHALCNALAPVCGDRCTMPKGHDGKYHECDEPGRGRSGWYGDNSDDPGSLESEVRCRPWRAPRVRSAPRCKPGAWGGNGCLAHEGHDIGEDGLCIEGRRAPPIGGAK